MSAIKIIEAIKIGDLDLVKSLIEKDDELANASSTDGLTLLMLSAYYGHMDIAECIAEFKKELTPYEAVALGKHQIVTAALNNDPTLLETYSGDGFTLLGLASFFNREALVRRLIAEGADVNKASDNGMQVSPLHSAIARKSLAISRILLEANAEVNATQQEGVTALHSAAYSGSVELVQLLLEKGADPSLKMNNGKSPADLALEAGFEELANSLK